MNRYRWSGMPNEEEGLKTARSLIGHYNGVARTLAFEPERYGPVLEMDEGSTEAFWQEWTGGFARAMRLRPGAWERIEGANELDVLKVVQVMGTLYAAAKGNSPLEAEKLEVLQSMAPALIRGMVRDLNARRTFRGASAAERIVPGVTPSARGKSERDSLCRRGSGIPYSRCCGAQ